MLNLTFHSTFLFFSWLFVLKCKIYDKIRYIIKQDLKINKISHYNIKKHNVALRRFKWIKKSLLQLQENTAVAANA